MDKCVENLKNFGKTLSDAWDKMRQTIVERMYNELKTRYEGIDHVALCEFKLDDPYMRFHVYADKETLQQMSKDGIGLNSPRFDFLTIEQKLPKNIS